MIEFIRIHVLVNSYDQDLPWDVLFYTLHVLVLPTAVIMAVLSGVNLAKDVNRSIRIKKAPPAQAAAACQHRQRIPLLAAGVLAPRLRLDLNRRVILS